MSKFTFIYMNNIYKITIKNKEELTEELIKYARAIGKYRTKLYFLYKGKPLTFEKKQYIFDYKKTYIIFVYDLEIKTEKNEEIENVLCPECGNLASIIINNDNKISIQNCKNKHKISNLTIDTFLFLQLNYNSNKYVECNICNNKKSYYNNFYVCSCGETICPLCKVEHNNNNHNIIDYNKRFLICKKHYKPFLSYCQSCYLNICSTCEAENHNSHKIKNLKEIQKNEKTLNEMQKEINDFKIKNNDYINEITKLNFNDFINNKKNTLKEYNQLNNIFLYLLYKSKNYENINTILNSKLKKMNKDYNNEIEIFINKLKSLMIKDDNKKNEMTIIYKNNNIKGKSKQKIQLFGQKFVDKNKNKCSLLINDKKYELMEVYNLDKSEEKKFLIIKLIEIKPTIDFSYMFYNCESLISIPDISNWNTNNIINLNYMFYNCRSLKSLPDISKWNTNKVIDISYMFFNCSSLQNLPDISKWNINNVKNKECIFSCVNEQVKLKNYELLKSFYNNEIKIKYKYQNKIKLFDKRFIEKNKNNCYLLIDHKFENLTEYYYSDNKEGKEIEIILIEKTEINDMSYMFYDCKSLISVKDILKWNVNNVIDMSYMFYNCESLISIPDISNWNTNNIINLNYMFYNCRSLKSLPDISKWNTNKVIDISYMFFNCSSLQNLPDISKWNINNVKNKECIFSCVNEQVKLKNYELLKSFYNNEIKIIYKNNVSFKIFDGDFVRNNENNFCLMVNNTKIELCSYIFGEDVEVKEAISVILIEINKITNMSYMFSGCDSLLSISDISKLNTSNVINMNHMFSGCNSLLPTSNILKLDTSKVIDISYMFSGCNSLTSLPDISKWDTKNVSNMEGIFSYCKSLTSLPDISKWDTKNVSNIKDMFRDCESLTSLPDISNWNTSNVINMNNLFCNCKSLTSFPNLSKWNNKNLKFEDDIFYNIDENVKNKNSNYIKKFIHNELTMIYKIKPEDSEIKLIEGSYYIENRIKLLINGNIQEKFSKYYTLKENDKKKEFIFVKLIDKGIKDMSEMFAGCESLISFQNLFEYRCKPLNLNSMFAGCKSLISLPDMSKWDMSEVTDISYIFFNCNSLKSLPDISKWDLNKVINIEWMFGNCLSLESLPDISNWNTSNVTNMSCMFCNCSSLKYPPDISNWNTSNVTDMGLIFTNCSSLLSLPDISHLNFEKVENKEYIFSNINEHIKNEYTNLIPNQVYNEMTLIYKNESEYGYYIDLFYFDSDYAFYQNNKKNFILKFHNLFLPPYYCICKQEENNEIVIKLIEKKKISNISEMFHGCHNLVKLFIPEGSTFNFNNIEGMFTYCSSLVSISNIFKYTSNITNIDELFYGCKSLQTLPDLSILDTSEVISMNRLFAGCESLKSIPDISKWNISKCSSMESLFEGCKSLISLPDISKWDTCNIKSMSYIFQDCKSLLSFPDISKWTTYNVEDMRKIFEGCESAKLSPEICKKFNVT